MRDIRNAPSAQVGDGATYSVGSDCYPATVIKVTTWSITIQDDHAKLVGGTTLSENQTWQYSRNPAGGTRTFRWSDKRKCYVNRGTCVFVGHRRRYHDPCF